MKPSSIIELLSFLKSSYRASTSLTETADRVPYLILILRLQKNVLQNPTLVTYLHVLGSSKLKVKKEILAIFNFMSRVAYASEIIGQSLSLVVNWLGLITHKLASDCISYIKTKTLFLTELIPKQLINNIYFNLVKVQKLQEEHKQHILQT